MAETSRTLEIVLRAKDMFTRHFATAGRAFMGVVRGTFSAGFRVLSAGFTMVRTAASSLGAAFLSIFAARRIASFVDATIEDADALQKLSVSLGTTTERLSELKAAFDFSGIGADFESTIQGLSKAMSQIFTRGPDTRQGNALQQLGIDVSTLRDADPLGLLQGIAKGLEQYSSENEKAAVLTGVFGKAFDTKLLVLLGRGEQEFMKNIQAARLFGATLRGDLAEAAEAAGDQIGFMKLQIGTAFRDAVLKVAQALVPVLEKMNEMLVAIRPELIGAIEALIRLLIRFAFVVADVVLLAVTKGVDAVQWFMEVMQRFLGMVESFGVRMPDAIREWFRPLSAEAAAARAQLQAVAAEVVALEESSRHTARGVGGASSPAQRDASAGLTEQRRQLTEAKARMAELAARFRELAGEEAAAGATSLALDTARLQRLREYLAHLGMQVAASFDGAEATRAVATEVRKLAVVTDDAAEVADTFWTRFVTGAKDAAKQYQDFLESVQSTTTALIDGGLGRVEDAFVDIITGAQSAKAAFRDMARSIIADITRWIVKLTILWLWQRLTGTAGGAGSGGGAEGLSTSAPPGHLGGTVSSAGGAGGGGGGFRILSGGSGGAQPSVFGSGGAGAFVPLRSGRIPTTIRGGGVGGTTNVTFNVTATDARGVRQMLIEERATILAVMNNGLQTSRTIRTSVRGVA